MLAGCPAGRGKAHAGHGARRPRCLAAACPCLSAARSCRCCLPLPSLRAHPACAPAPQTHFLLANAVLDECDAAQPWRDLRSVLAAHANVKLLLMGYFHKARAAALDTQHAPAAAHQAP